MTGEPYDWQRDLALDFPDEYGEPDTGEVKDTAYRCMVGGSAGEYGRHEAGVRDA